MKPIRGRDLLINGRQVIDGIIYEPGGITGSQWDEVWAWETELRMEFEERAAIYEFEGSMNPGHACIFAYHDIKRRIEAPGFLCAPDPTFAEASPFERVAPEFSQTILKLFARLTQAV